MREVLRVLARPAKFLASSWVLSADPATDAWNELLDATAGAGTAQWATAEVGPLESYFSLPENLRASLSAAGFDSVRVEEVHFSSEHTVEEYVAERSLNAPGRLARHVLGEAEWRVFLAGAAAEFRRRFGERVAFNRRVLLAAATAG